MQSLDARWYRDINSFAAHTVWLHGAMEAAAGAVGLAALAVLLLAALRRARHSGNPPVAVASTAWAVVAAALAVAVSHLVTHLVGRPRPFETLPGAHVLVAPVRDFSFPSGHAVAAGAVVAALLFSDRLVAGAAAVVAVVLAFARVYVGLEYPGDVAGGLALGVAAAVVIRPLGMAVLTWLTVRVERSPLHWLVAAAVPDPDLVSLPRSPT